MELFTVTMAHNNKLFSVPLSQLQGMGEARDTPGGFIKVAGAVMRTVESYEALVSAWQDLNSPEVES